MSTASRLCRICLTPEDNVKFQRILDGSKRFALDLFFVSQIKVNCSEKMIIDWINVIIELGN